MRWASRRETLSMRRLDVDGLEDLLLLVGRRVHVGRDHVGERGGRLDALDGGEQFGRRLRQKLHRLDRLSLEVDEARLDVVRHRASARGSAARARRRTASRSGIR